MTMSQMYIIVAIVVLLAVAILVFGTRRSETRDCISPLGSFAFAFVLAGMLFGNNRIIGYGLMAAGILLALIDMFNGLRKA